MLQARRIFALVALIAILCAVVSPSSAIVWALIVPVLFFVALVSIRVNADLPELLPVSSDARAPLPSRAPPQR